MTTLDDIKTAVSNELEQFEVFYKDALHSDNYVLDRIGHYTLKHKGKQLRPLFVFLSAKCFGDVNESTYRAATFIELLHSATLTTPNAVSHTVMLPLQNGHFRSGASFLSIVWCNASLLIFVPPSYSLVLETGHRIEKGVSTAIRPVWIAAPDGELCAAARPAFKDRLCPAGFTRFQPRAVHLSKSSRSNRL